MNAGTPSLLDAWQNYLTTFKWDWFATLTFRELVVGHELADKKFRLWKSKLNRRFAGSNWHKLQAERFVIVLGDSVFSVITHKAGVASGLAHNHFVVAGQPSLVLDFDPHEPMSTSFRLEAALENLIVDGPGRHERWSDRLQQLSILDEGPKELSVKNRAKIREAMLGRRQLDVATFPTLSVEAVGFENSPTRLGGVDFPYAASFEVELHGKSVRLKAASRYEWDHALCRTRSRTGRTGEIAG